MTLDIELAHADSEQINSSLDEIVLKYKVTPISERSHLSRIALSKKKPSMVGDVNRLLSSYLDVNSLL